MAEKKDSAEDVGGYNTGDDSGDDSGDDWLTPNRLKQLVGYGTSAAVELLGGNDPQIEKAGYQGGIPKYTSSRERVPYTDDPYRRPGSSGQRYFTDVGFSRTPEDPSVLAAQNILNPVREDTRAARPALGGISNINTFADLNKLTSPQLQQEKSGIANELLRLRGDAGTNFGPQPNKRDNINIRSPEYQAYLDGWRPPPYGPVSQVIEGWRNTKTGETHTANTGGWTPPSDDWVRDMSVLDAHFAAPNARDYAALTMAAGGIAQVDPRYFAGSSDGMADSVPANIDGQQEARLSDGEFVMPADIVSHLGNGNSNAGADVLYNMMDRVRQARTGTEQQGRQINPNKMLPV